MSAASPRKSARRAILASGTQRKATPAPVDELAAYKTHAEHVTEWIHSWSSQIDDDVGDLRAVVAHLESQLAPGFERILEAAKESLDSLTYTTSYMRAEAWFGG